MSLCKKKISRLRPRINVGSRAYTKKLLVRGQPRVREEGTREKNWHLKILGVAFCHFIKNTQ